MPKWLRLFIGFGTLAALIYYGASAPEYWRALANLSWQTIAATYLVVTLGRAVMSWKWNLLLAVTTRPLPLTRAIQIYCSSQVYGLALPATVGGDAVRIAFTTSEGRPAADVTASVVVERMIGMVVTLLVGVLAMLVAGLNGLSANPAYLAALGLMTALFAAAFIAILASMNQSLFHFLHDRLLHRFAENRVAKLLRRIHDAYLGFRGELSTLLLFSAGTVVEVLLHALLLYLLLLGLGWTVPFAFVLAALISASLLARLPISVAGLGVFEAGFVYVLSLHGVPVETSLLTSILSRIVQLAVWLPWWGAYIASRPESARIPDNLASRRNPH